MPAGMAGLSPRKADFILLSKRDRNIVAGREPRTHAFLQLGGLPYGQTKRAQTTAQKLGHEGGIEPPTNPQRGSACYQALCICLHKCTRNLGNNYCSRSRGHDLLRRMLGLAKGPRPCTELYSNKKTKKENNWFILKIHPGVLNSNIELAIIFVLVI